MTASAVVDIGSNTIVLNIYTWKDGKPLLQETHSEAVGLVSYIQNGTMKPEGIAAACRVLGSYRERCRQVRPDQQLAFITEPARGIDNRAAMLAAFQQAGFTVDALTGEEEALYDFAGSRLDTGDILTGNAFDVGGGSTELLSFRDDQVLKAVSLPLGCVRLKTMPLENKTVDLPLAAAGRAAPELLETPAAVLVGIGGTCRAAGLLLDALFNSGKTMNVPLLQQVYDHLKAGDERYVKAMHKSVHASRWPVFLPGVNMILGICRFYSARQIRVSDGCVREGYLLCHQEKSVSGSRAADNR